MQALATLQVIVVQAQQISKPLNERNQQRWTHQAQTERDSRRSFGGAANRAGQSRPTQGGSPHGEKPNRSRNARVVPTYPWGQWPSAPYQHAAIITGWDKDTQLANLMVFPDGESYTVALNPVEEGTDDGTFQAARHPLAHCRDQPTTEAAGRRKLPALSGVK